MKTQRNLGMLMAVALLMALPALAQSGYSYGSGSGSSSGSSNSSSSTISREGDGWVQVITGTLAAARVLKVDTECGSIHINGGSQSGIQYMVRKRAMSGSEDSAKRQFEQFRISARSGGDTAVIEGHGGGSYRRFSVEFTITVPKGTEVVNASTAGGSVQVNGVNGKVMAETSGGGITLADIAGPVSAETAGGSIDASNIAREVKLESQGGGIQMRTMHGRVSASTAGGSIDLADADQDVRLETAGGGITLRNVKGRVTAQTAGGSIEADNVAQGGTVETAGGSIRVSECGEMKATTAGGGIRLLKLRRGVRAETAAGPITAEFVGKSSDFTESSLSTSVGDVIVYLPADIHVTIRASIETAMGHKIRSDFPELKITSEGGQWGPKEVYANGQINGGGPLLKISTTMGNIELRKGSR